MQERSFQHGALDGTRGYHHIISHPHILIITIITLSFYYLSLPPFFSSCLDTRQSPILIPLFFHDEGSSMARRSGGAFGCCCDRR